MSGYLTRRAVHSAGKDSVARPGSAARLMPLRAVASIAIVVIAAIRILGPIIGTVFNNISSNLGTV